MSEYKFTLDEETREYCRENLNETEETRSLALNDLGEWLATNPHLNINPHSFLPFLRACKFDLERTKAKLVNYQKLRREAPEWFRNRNPLLMEIQELVRLGVFVPLKKTFENQLVVIIRTAVHNPKRHKQDDVFKAGKMVLDVACMENERAHIYGVIALFDMDGVSLGHARQLSPGMIKKAVFAWQNYHCRPKRLEFVNAPNYINVVLSIFKGFMSDKLKGRVQVHYGGVEAIQGILPKEILPVEYGGDEESILEMAKYWQGKLFDYSKWFEKDETFIPTEDC